MDGWIKLHRSLLEWEWYSDVNTRLLFIHLLLSVNYEDKEWRGITIKRGQLVYSRATLAKQSGLSEQGLRTALRHLISTKDITNKTTPQYSIITISNYDKYQSITNELTNDQPTINQPPTNDQPAINHNIRNKEIKKYNNSAFSPEDTQCFFESVWKLYPNKKGKGQVSDAAKGRLQKVGYEQIKRCVERYLSDLAKESWRKPQNGSTFFNSGYVDYLDENYGNNLATAKDDTPFLN